MLILLAASGLVALGAVLAFFAFAGGSSGGGDGGGATAIERTMRGAGCTFRTYPGLPRTHLSTVDAKPNPKWNSSPPSSGPHYQQPAIWGAYDRPIALTLSTHNLEHGGIVVHYGPRVPAAEQEKLRDFYADDPNGIVLAPLASAGDEIILSAWFSDESRAEDEKYQGEGKQARCTTVDEDAFAAFRDAFRYKGPERIPAENLQPGM